MKCEWCRTEVKRLNELVLTYTTRDGLPVRFYICDMCMDLFINQEFDELSKRVERL